MASIASLIVKIGAQDQEISAALEKLVGNARRADADLSKLGSTPLGQAAIKSTAELAAKIQSITDAQQRFADKAVDAARGIETIGGASRLMAGQLDQVAATLNKGVDAFRALGQDAPKDLLAVASAVGQQQEALKNMASATKGASDATSGWLPILHDLGSSWVARIAEGILLRDAIQAIIGKIKDMATALPELALKGSAVADVEDNFKRLTEQSGRLGDTLLGSLRSGTHSTVADFELMKTANQDLAAGLNLTDKQFGTLATGAFALAQATGGDVKTALDTMNDAMLTGRTRALALLTGKIDLKTAEEKFATSLGTTADHLTAEGKLEAARAAILDSVAGATKRLGDQTDGLDESVAQGQVAWANFTDQLGKSIATSTTLEAGIGGLKTIITEAFGGTQQQAIQAITDKIDQALIAMVSFAEVGVRSAGFLAKEFYAVEKVFGDSAQAIDLLSLGAAKLERFKLKSSDLFGIDPQTQTQIRDVDKAIADLNERIKARGIALQEDDRQQAAVDGTTTGYVKTLEDLRQKMQAAHDNAKAFVGPLQQITTSTNSAAEASKTHGLVMDQTAGEAKKLEAALRKAAEAQQKFLDSVQALSFKQYVTDAFPMVGLIRDISGQAISGRDNFDDLNASVNEFHDGMTIAGDTITTVAIPAFGKLQDIKPINSKVLEDARKTADGIREAFEGLGKDLPNILSHAFEGGGGLSGALKSIATKLGADFAKELNASIAKDVKVGGSGLTASGVGSAGVLGAGAGIGAAAGGASPKQAIGAVAGTALAVGIGSYTAATAAAAASGVAATGAIGGALALGAATAGIGIAAIGAYYGLKKLFSASEESKINPLRQSFVDAAGGLDALNKHANEVGISLSGLLNAKNATQYNAAIDQLNVAFAKEATFIADSNTELGKLLKSGQELGVKLPNALNDSIQKLIDMGKITGDNATLFASLAGNNEVDFKKMSEVAGKYGIDLASLGPAFQSAKLNDAAASVINDFDTLTRGGADVDAVLTGMKKPINDIVNESIKFGVDIPANMKPWVEQLVKTGQLTDANGDKITDLSQLKFSDPIVTEFQKIVDKIQELIDKLGKPITDAVNNIPKNIPIDVGVNVHYNYDAQREDAFAATGGLVVPGGIQHFAVGGRVLPFVSRGSGTDTVPAWLTPGEVVLNRDQQQAVASAFSGASAGGYDDSGVRGELSELRRQIATDLPKVLARAVRDEVQKVSRRR